MSGNINEILKKYWGYDSFRPIQEDIIRSILGKLDTLALMPTGGGKSITFQIPALALEGTCLVVTPLISLMKDQVESLIKLGIKAMFINSAMTREELDVNLNNCIYGGYKFLYVSPERLGTELFLTRLQKMAINLIAVDEAHCISKWGYDFRPSYLKIADLRKYLPDIPVLALSATATPKVANDIIEKLQFKKHNICISSFERENLAYLVRYTEDKQNYLLKIINNIEGSGIIYVRSRKKAKELAIYLKKHNVSANYYHAGLTDDERSARQNEWKSGFTRIIIATNAFGMGIDKPDVRFVIHFEPPDSLEAYFQEAGRAGRDGHKSFAILLCDNNDKIKLEKNIDFNFPEIQIIKNVYQALGNYLKVPYGGGKDIVYDFDIARFSSICNQSAVVVYNCLKILQLEGYIVVSKDLNTPSKIHFLTGRDDLYKFQVANASFDGFIKLLLRSYSGMFTDFVAIDERTIARRAKINAGIVYQYLNKLSTSNIISYIPRKNTPVIIYTEERLDEKTLRISSEAYKLRKEIYTGQVMNVIKYSFSENICRSRMLLEYFGEKKTHDCGICDVCSRKNDTGLTTFEFEQIKNNILQKLNEYPSSFNNLTEFLNFKSEKIIKVIRWLLDNNIVSYLDDQTIMLNK